jgi:hypothetical protein
MVKTLPLNEYRVSIEVDIKAPNPRVAKRLAIEKIKLRTISEIDFQEADYKSVSVELLSKG